MKYELLVCLGPHGPSWLKTSTGLPGSHSLGREDIHRPSWHELVGTIMMSKGMVEK